MLQQYTVLTPEKTLVEYRIAGLGSRVFAYLIDLVLLIAYMMLVTYAATVLAFLDPGAATLVAAVASLAVPFGYHWLFETFWNGQTPGKKALGLRVRMADGTPITPAAAFLRNALRIADMLPGTYTVGITAIFFTERSQRLGDLAAGTIVVHEGTNKDPVRLASGLTSEQHPLEHLLPDIRGLTLEEYLAVKTLCDRYPELPASVQQRMLKEVWMPVALRLKIPEYSNIHPVYIMEALVMKYAREKGFL